MSQKISPFVEGKYGWNYGESGWNSGMDENLTKFSFLFDRNIDGIVSDLPSNPPNGQAFFLTADNRLYFRVDAVWYSSPTPKWFILRLRSDGTTYEFSGTSLVRIDSSQELENSISEIQATLTTLGTAAFKDETDFATTEELDIVEANSSNYTDQLATSLSSLDGAFLVGYGQTTVGDHLNQLEVESSVTYRIPSDFSSISEAVLELSSKNTKNGVNITLLIESGHALQSGCIFRNGDFSKFTISSVDPVVKLSSSFTGVSVSSIPTLNNSLFVVSNARGPIINTLFDMELNYGAGLHVTNGSFILVNPNKGVTGAGTFGFYLDNASKMQASTANFSKCNNGSNVTTSSHLNAQGIDCSESYVPEGGGACLYVSRGSIVNVMFGKFDKGIENGLTARRSLVSASNSTATQCNGIGYLSEYGASLIAHNTFATNCATGYMCDASMLTASSASAENCTTVGAFCQNAGTMNIPTSTFSNCVDGIVGLTGSNINAEGCTAIDCTVDNVRVVASRINVASATLTGATGVGLHARHGSTVAALNANTRKTPGEDSTSDMRAINGSTIQANGATGGANIALNTLTANGIVFK